MAPASRYCLAGSSASEFLTRLQSKCWPEQLSHVKAWLGKFTWKLLKELFLVGYWTKGFRFCWLLASGCPHFLAMWPSPVPSLLLQIQTGIELTESASKMEVTILSDVITEVTSNVFVILLMRSHTYFSMWVQPTFKGRWTRGCEYQEVAIIGNHFRSWLQGSKCKEGLNLE